MKGGLINSLKKIEIKMGEGEGVERGDTGGIKGEVEGFEELIKVSKLVLRGVRGEWVRRIGRREQWISDS